MKHTANESNNQLSRKPSCGKDISVILDDETQDDCKGLEEYEFEFGNFSIEDIDYFMGDFEEIELIDI
jgi:hypothetical protein